MRRVVILLAVTSFSAAAWSALPELPDLPALPPPPPVTAIASDAAATRFADVFTPFRTTHAALSPDGRHLAYSLREGENLSIVVLEIDRPAQMKAKVTVANDSQATPMMALESREKTPAEIRWLGWVTPDRLAVETNQNFPSYEGGDEGAWINTSGAIIAFDADGGNARTLVTPANVARFVPAPTTSLLPARETAFTTPDQVPVEIVEDADATIDSNGDPNLPTGSRQHRSPVIHDFSPDSPDALLVRTAGRNEFARFQLDVRTGKLTLLDEERIDGLRRPLLDRLGRPRVTLPATTRTSFPHAYEYESGRGLLRWRKLDPLAGFTDGRGFSVSPDNYFGERAVPVAFDDNPDLLYFASNLGRDTFGIYGLDLKTGGRSPLAMEHPALDLFTPGSDGFASRGTLVFDRHTRALAGVRIESSRRTVRWLRPDMQEVQLQLESSFPGQSVELLEWDRDVRRFLVRVHSPADPGAYHVFDRDTRRLSEFVRRAPAGNGDERPYATLGFTFDHPVSGRINGLITFPRQVPQHALPMVFLLPAEWWERTPVDYQPEVQALVRMNFAIVQINPRGAWGSGLARREAIKGGYEEVQAADILHTVEFLPTLFRVNPRRVALIGRERGAYLALRALQLHPDRFRSAVTLNPTLNLGGWLSGSRWNDERRPEPLLTRSFYGDPARLKEAPLVREPERITRPLLILSYPGPADQSPLLTYLDARQFAGAVRRRGATVEFADLEADFMRNLPRARSSAFQRIELFLFETLYDFKVDVGETIEVPEPQP